MSLVSSVLKTVPTLYKYPLFYLDQCGIKKLPCVAPRVGGNNYWEITLVPVWAISSSNFINEYKVRHICTAHSTLGNKVPELVPKMRFLCSQNNILSKAPLLACVCSGTIFTEHPDPDLCLSQSLNSYQFRRKKYKVLKCEKTKDRSESSTTSMWAYEGAIVFFTRKN